MTKTEEQAADLKRRDRKTFQGTVVSDRMNKTRVVKVQRLVRHPFYEKIMRKFSKFSVHDGSNSSHEGDVVEIMSTRPLSKTKRWRIIRVIKAAPRFDKGALI
ncbi:MAG: 30S ribosomal protein S17 [Elusimicrobia bacterium RIFCSPHIGHO2_02_FULL_57_9]|nr:MAG: 30S ribosomal protein S17 [Elusimicrobia bacterium RIFCSPHIGHO2_02_FULL_57_9]